MKLLVFGAEGQLGRALGRVAVKRGIELIGLSHADCDITRREAVNAAVAAAGGFEVAVNAAAFTKVDAAESEPELCFAVNEAGARHIAEACAAEGIPLIQISTDYVFDGRKDCPYREEDAPHPINVYGASKLAGEQAVLAASDGHIVIRTSWLYGPNEGNFLATMLRLAKTRDSLSVVDDQFGCPTVTDDLAEAICRLAETASAAGGAEAARGLFHFCGTGPITWCHFARAIFAEAERHGLRVPKVMATTTAAFAAPAPRPLYSALDCGRITGLLGIAQPDWRDGVRRVVASLLTVEGGGRDAAVKGEA